MRLSQESAARIAVSAVILYLSAHALTGRQGLFSYVALQAQERALTDEGAALDAEIADLQTRARLLRPDSLDLDYLEERARVLLNATKTGEIVFLTPGENAGPP